MHPLTCQMAMRLSQAYRGSVSFLAVRARESTNLLRISSGLLTSLESVGVKVELLESSRNRTGVMVIFRVSWVSSLKKESVLRRVPFLDLPGAPSSMRSQQNFLGNGRKSGVPGRRVESSLDLNLDTCGSSEAACMSACISSLAAASICWLLIFSGSTVATSS